MPVHQLGHLTWDQVRDLDRARTLAIIPVGATEAHGPHLPLATDVVIAEAMARRGAEKLAQHGAEVLLLPPIAYSAAAYAASFAGTLSIRPETASALLVDIGRALASHGITALVIANAHLDPAHIGSIRAAMRALAEPSGGSSAPAPQVVFPDVTRKPWALRLSDEFKSGACHAGQYEGSIVLAEAPELVRDDVRRALPANPRSLSDAIRAGLDTFEAAGGPQAYFGDPAAATADEGRGTIETLGTILCEATCEAIDWLPPPADGSLTAATGGSRA